MIQKRQTGGLVAWLVFQGHKPAAAAPITPAGCSASSWNDASSFPPASFPARRTGLTVPVISTGGTYNSGNGYTVNSNLVVPQFQIVFSSPTLGTMTNGSVTGTATTTGMGPCISPRPQQHDGRHQPDIEPQRELYRHGTSANGRGADRLLRQYGHPDGHHEH